MGSGAGSSSEKRLEAKGRDDEVFIFLFPSLANSVAEAPLVFCFFFWGRSWPLCV